MKYKLLGNSGLRVSEVCLGTMTFGEDWGWGADKAACKDIVKIFLDSGGNFIDTANYYTNGSSETILGELLEGIRHSVVLATKYSLLTDPHNINAGGNQKKNMVYSIEQSLKRLGTDYIDLFWVHIWDQVTPVEEVLRGLEDLVRTGKVLYTGISDTPAWIIAKSNAIAHERDWTKYSAIQVEYNLAERTVERELIPMATADNLSVLAWSPLAGGLLTGKYGTDTKNGKNGARLEDDQRLNLQSIAIIDTLKDVAQELNTSPAAVALAWVKQNPIVIPIIGARKASQLSGNLEAIHLHLSEENLEKLNSVSQVKLGFPNDFINSEQVQRIIHGAYKRELLV
jgi:aryl-alcohol dehydrogenase-like predicted oxidoreductase